MMKRARPPRHEPATPATPAVASPHEIELRRQLRNAQSRLTAALLRCDQLEAQLSAGRQREHHHQVRAEHDELTGLFNRGAFRERVRRALADGVQVAVMMLDLDGFKRVNDCHGHAAGDEALCIIAARIGHALRNGDVVGRLGGDEFACLLHNVGSPDQLAALAGKLGASIASPMQVAGHRLSLPASLGLAVSPDDGACVDTLLAHADAAMYRVKQLHQANRPGRPRAASA